MKHLVHPYRFVAAIIMSLVAAALLWHYAAQVAHIDRTIVQGLNDAPLGVIICDADAHVLYVNAGVTVLSGFTVQEIMAGGMDVLIPPDMRAQHTQALQTVAQRHPLATTPAGTIFRRITPMVCKDGKLLKVSLTIALTHINGRPQFLAFIVPWGEASDDTLRVPPQDFKN